MSCLLRVDWCSLFAVSCILFDVFCSLVVVRCCALRAVCGLLFCCVVVRCFVVCCWLLFVDLCPLFVWSLCDLCCTLSVVPCSLFVGRFLSVVVCCLLPAACNVLLVV